MEDTDNVERPVKRQRLSPVSAGADNTASGSANRSQEGQILARSTLTTDAKEAEVGITEFVSRDVTPFQAILKKRYTDFLVNEVLPSGEVVHLTDTSVPQKLSSGSSQTLQGKKTSSGAKPEPSTQSSSSNEARPAPAGQVLDGSSVQPETLAPGEISESDKNQLVEYLNDKAVDELLRLHQAILNHPTKKAKDHPLVRTELTSDRGIRTEIHAAIRRIFASKIESATDQEGFLCLTAARPDSRQPARRGAGGPSSRHPGKLDWLERGGDYLHFSLYKENKDTMEVISFLTRQTKTSAKMFQFAGTKDRRAVTCQRVSAYRIDPDRLVRLNSILRNAAVGNFECKPYSLELGDLGGNEFTLTLRECNFAGMADLSMNDKLAQAQSAIQLALTNLESKGFLNYYGLQRFGTFATRTDMIGLYILKGDFRSACEGILHYNADLLELTNPESNRESNSTPASDPAGPHSGPGRDEIARAKAINLFQKTANAHKPTEILPRKFSAENQIMRHLARSPTDYIGALLAVPRNLRLMYVHAYQSLIWNRAASRRWQLFGRQVVEGDLVLIKEHKDKEVVGTGDGDDGSSGTVSATQELEPDVTGDIDADGEIIITPSAHDRSLQVDDIFDRARALTAAEASSGEYNIFDVVLPLPGYDVLYPSNASGEFYKELMGSETGGGLDPYHMRRKQKDFSLSGGYRKMLACIPKEFDTSVHSYQKDEEQFVVTDWERIKGQTSVLRVNGGENKIKPRPEQSMSEPNQAVEEEDMDAKMTDDVSDDILAVTNKGNATNTTFPSSVTGNTEAGVGGEVSDLTDKVAVVLKFQLGASQYATMALRELSRGGIVAYQAESGAAK